MSVNYFQALNSAITQNIADICQSDNINEEEAIAQVQHYLKKNKDAYYSDIPQIDYSNPLCRTAYLYNYVGAHANLINNALYKFSDLGQFVVEQIHTVNELHICSFGGGPGSEFLGFVKFIERNRQHKSPIWLNFALVDKVCAWDESWQKLVNGLQCTFREHYGARNNWPVAIERSFLPLDLTRLQDFQQFPVRFKDVQIYVLNYVVSEIMAYTDMFTIVIAHIVRLASDGAYFLFIDRNQEEVVYQIRQIIVSAGLQCVGATVEQSYMDHDEQKTDLGKWHQVFGWSPQLTWNAFFALARKAPNTSLDDLPF